MVTIQIQEKGEQKKDYFFALYLIEDYENEKVNSFIFFIYFFIYFSIIHDFGFLLGK